MIFLSARNEKNVTMETVRSKTWHSWRVKQENRLHGNSSMITLQILDSNRSHIDFISFFYSFILSFFLSFFLSVFLSFFLPFFLSLFFFFVSLSSFNFLPFSLSSFLFYYFLPLSLPFILSCFLFFPFRSSFTCWNGKESYDRMGESMDRLTTGLE